jgi:hypothetical protein
MFRTQSELILFLTGCWLGVATISGSVLEKPPWKPDDLRPTIKPPRTTAFLPERPVSVCPSIVGSGPPPDVESFIEK